MGGGKDGWAGRREGEGEREGRAASRRWPRGVAAGRWGAAALCARTAGHAGWGAITFVRCSPRRDSDRACGLRPHPVASCLRRLHRTANPSSSPSAPPLPRSSSSAAGPRLRAAARGVGARGGGVAAGGHDHRQHLPVGNPPAAGARAHPHPTIPTPTPAPSSSPRRHAPPSTPRTHTRAHSHSFFLLRGLAGARSGSGPCSCLADG